MTVGSGSTELFATRGLDVTSNRVDDLLGSSVRSCPEAHGRKIVGTRTGDRLPRDARLRRDPLPRRRRRINLRRVGVNAPTAAERRRRRAREARRRRRPDPRQLRGGPAELSRFRPVARPAGAGGRCRRAGRLRAGPRGRVPEGTATLTVTRDYGTEPMVEASVEDPAESETVLRMLDREADITTRYGGGFVQSIEGVAGEVSRRGGRFDWFFYVNGIESPGRARPTGRWSAATGSGGTTAIGPTRCESQPWSAPGPSRSCRRRPSPIACRSGSSARASGRRARRRPSGSPTRA